MVCCTSAVPLNISTPFRYTLMLPPSLTATNCDHCPAGMRVFVLASYQAVPDHRNVSSKSAVPPGTTLIQLLQFVAPTQFGPPNSAVVYGVNDVGFSHSEML